LEDGMKTPAGMPSASRLQLATMCPASQALPHVDSHHEAGDEGNDLHELLRRSLTDKNWTATDAQMKWRDAVLETIGDRFPPDVSAELAFGFDTATGATIPHGAAIGRNYPQSPTVINGSVDYVAVGTDKALAIDLKTGLADVAAVHRNQQLRFAALVVGAWTGLPAQTAILHAPRDGRRPWWEWGPTYDALDLVEVGDVFKAMAARITDARRDVAAGKTPRLTTGKHCEHCPARLRCPAQVELVSRWAGKPVEAKRELEQLMDVETAGLAWARVEAVEAAVKEAKRQLYAFASVQPFPLADGRIVGKHREKSQRLEVDAEKARAWLLANSTPAVAEAAIEMVPSTSKTRIWDAVSAATPRGKKRDVADALVERMKADGVLVEKWTDTVGPYDPRDSSTQAVTDAPRLEATTDGAP
jgi:hypothetical protein